MATKTGKSKQNKKNVRVDFTPMVDMNMLLITFFMLCTSLVKPQTMELAMPSNDKKVQEQDKSEVKASKAVTILLDKDNRLYYFEGEPNTNDPKSLKQTDYSANGLRAYLMEKNLTALEEKQKLDEKMLKNEIKEEQYKTELSAIKGNDNTPTVIIKAFPGASYRNLVDALDEMTICAIGKYVIGKTNDTDTTLIKNLTGKLPGE